MADTIATDWTWITKHLVLLTITIGLIFGGIYFTESLIAKHDAATEAKYSQILAVQTVATQAVETKLANDEANWTALATQLTAQNAQLTQQISVRDAQMQQLINKISAMQPPQLVSDLQPKLRAGNATSLPDGVKLDVLAARDVDEQITEGTTAKTDLAAAKTELANETTIATNAQADATESKLAVTAEQKKNVDQVQACTAEVNTIKADAKKSKSKWFFIGVAVGYLGRWLTVK